MNRKVIVALIGALILCAGLGAGGSLVTGADFDISWYTIDGGGGTSAGGDFVLSGTIGQPDAGSLMTGGGFELAGGFWPGSNGIGSACPADLNFDEVVNIDDLFAVLAGWGPCDDCIEDINDDGVVDIDDLFAVLAEWGPCP